MADPRVPDSTSSRARRDDPGRRAGLGAFDIGCVVVGGIIGVGIFFTPAKVAAKVDGPGQVAIAWGLGAIIASLGALVFAELAARRPGHGGMFVYISEGVGRIPAYLYGFANCFFIQAGAAGIIGLVLVENLAVAATGRVALSADAEVALACAGILVFTLVNLLGLRVGRGVQNTLTVLKVTLIAGLVVMSALTAASSAAGAGGVGAGAVGAGGGPSGPHHGLAAALAGAILPVLFSFGGWQQGSFVAGAARRPRRDVPLGILGGVAVVVVCYLSINLAFLHILGFHDAAGSNTIAVDAARRALAPAGAGAGELAARLVGAMVAVSAMGILNTICLAPPFVLLAMARRGLFFERAGRLHPRFGNPSFGIAVQGVAGLVLLLAVHLAFRSGSKDTLGFLLDGVVFVDWLFFALCAVALLRLRRIDARAAAGAGAGAGAEVARIPLGSLLPLLFAAFAVSVTAGAIATSPRASLLGLCVTIAGTLFVGWLRRPRASAGAADPAGS